MTTAFVVCFTVSSAVGVDSTAAIAAGALSVRIRLTVIMLSSEDRVLVVGAVFGMPRERKETRKGEEKQINICVSVTTD